MGVMPCCGSNHSSEWPNSCNLNLYTGGDMSVGWHADDEQLFQGKSRDCRILSLSLGATRSFDLRLNWPDASWKPKKLMIGKYRRLSHQSHMAMDCEAHPTVPSRRSEQPPWIVL